MLTTVICTSAADTGVGPAWAPALGRPALRPTPGPRGGGGSAPQTAGRAAAGASSRPSVRPTAAHSRRRWAPGHPASGASLSRRRTRPLGAPRPDRAGPGRARRRATSSRAPRKTLALPALRPATTSLRNPKTAALRPPFPSPVARRSGQGC